MSTILLSALVNSAILSAAATAVIWSLLRLTPRRTLNAATRYGMWFVALLLVVGLPVAFIPMRKAVVPAAPSLGSLPLGEFTHSPLAGVVVDPPVPANSIPPEVSMTPDRAFPGTSAGGNWTSEWAVRTPGPLRVREGWWLYGLLVVWSIATAYFLARLLLGYRLLLSRRASAWEAPVFLQQHVTNPTRVLVSEEIDTPLAIGFRRPTIIIPSGFIGRFSEEELRQMCLHECAHLVRRDDLTLLAQRFIQALFPWHPAVRWICRQLELEREIACDDYVIQTTAKPRDYASCLARVAELGGAPEAVLTTPTVIGNGSDLERRVDALLEKRRARTSRLLLGRFAASIAAILLIGFSFFSGPARELFAFAQLGQLLDLPPQVQAIADAALDAPPELTADVLLRLVERGHITDPRHKRQALENAWNLAPKAKHRHELTAAVGGISTESGVAALSTALRPRARAGLSTAGLQLRVLDQMAVLDPQAARDMFGAMARPEVQPVACPSDRYNSHTPYFEAVELMAKTFDSQSTRAGERTRFLNNAFRSLANPSDLISSLALIQKDNTLSDAEFIEILNQWSETLAEVRFTDRVYSARSLLSLSGPTIEAAKKAQARGGSAAGTLRPLRAYIVRHANAVRCDDGPGRTATTGPGQPQPANNEETARLAFNAAVSELAPDILPIKAEEIVARGSGGTAKVIQYINWFSQGDVVPPDVARNRYFSEQGKKLRFGTPEQLAANNARRTTPVAATLTIEQRSTPEWNAEALRYLNELENWSRDLTQTNIEVFFQKTYWYGNLLEIIPDGKLRDTILRSYVTHLATSPVQLESPPEWARRVRELIDFRDVQNRRQWIGQIEAAGDRTIGLFCKLARLELDAGIPGRP
jgi:beta-lactamase regulating signal transducer with metallopeptidase domain